MNPLVVFNFQLINIIPLTTLLHNLLRQPPLLRASGQSQRSKNSPLQVQRGRLRDPPLRRQSARHALAEDVIQCPVSRSSNLGRSDAVSACKLGDAASRRTFNPRPEGEKFEE